MYSIVLSFNIAIFCSKTLRRKENLIINFICLTRDEKEKESSFIEKEKERERERERKPMVLLLLSLFVKHLRLLWCTRDIKSWLSWRKPLWTCDNIMIDWSWQFFKHTKRQRRNIRQLRYVIIFFRMTWILVCLSIARINISQKFHASDLSPTRCGYMYMQARVVHYNKTDKNLDSVRTITQGNAEILIRNIRPSFNEPSNCYLKHAERTIIYLTYAYDRTEIAW